MDISDKLRKVLKDKGHSATSTRTKVFEALVQIHKPITVVDLVTRLKAVDKVSVYRTVQLFESIGITHRVWTGFKSKIELSEAFSTHHHHFSCIKCGLTLSIESTAMEKSLHDLEHKHGFELIQHSVELSGYCIKCRTAKVR